jgi:hypothetical protein
VNGQLHVPAALFPEKIPGINRIRGYVVPRAGLDDEESPIARSPSPYRSLAEMNRNKIKYIISVMCTKSITLSGVTSCSRPRLAGKYWLHLQGRKVITKKQEPSRAKRQRTNTRLHRVISQKTIPLWKPHIQQPLHFLTSRYSDGSLAGRSGFDSRQFKISLFSTASRPTLGPSQPPSLCETEGDFPGGKAAGAWSWLLTSI